MSLSFIPVVMAAVEITAFGGPKVLRLAERPVPVPAADEVLIRVDAAGVNRADLMQRAGKYPPPAGASDLPGLEVAGTIAKVGAAVTSRREGEAVVALLAGGGYAEFVAAKAAQCLPLPVGFDMIQGAASVEAVATVYANLFEVEKSGAGGLQAGQTALIHGGTSGIGSFAIQMAKQAGASVITTVGNPAKVEVAYALGADFVVNYRSEDFVEAGLRATNRRGVEVVLDMVGGDYVDRNLRTLAPGGRHVSIATQAGAMAAVNIGRVMARRLVLTGSTLRARPDAEKARLLGEVGRVVWPWLAAGKVKPLVDRTFPLADAAEAHRVLEAGEVVGKVVLRVK